jgi:tRNA (cytidine/uridine-2'-O-)-methyltransferase
LLQIALVEPEIPQNTGSIGRTCVALGAALHLVHPLGFQIDEKACRRAGLDYWPRLRLREHARLADYEALLSGERFWLFSSHAPRTHFDADFAPGDHLVFGRESVGLPAEFIERHAERVLSLPMRPGERSLNISNAVAVAAYEAVRQFRDAGLARTDAEGRLVLPG